MSIQTIACDSCEATYQTTDAPVKATAPQVGWHVDDVTLCSECGKAWLAADPHYGAHARPVSVASEGYWHRQADWFAWYLPHYRRSPAHRPCAHEGCVVHHTVNELAHRLSIGPDYGTFRRAVNIRADRAVERAA